MIPPGALVSFRRSTAVPPEAWGAESPRKSSSQRAGRSHPHRPFALLVLLFVALGADAATQPVRVEKVERVIDGDTVVLASGEVIRLAGINTPELARKDQPEQPLAREARDALQELIAGHAIEIQEAPGNKDRYGRTLAYLLIPTGDTVQELLLRQGLASVVVIAPNDFYLTEFVRAEDDARRLHRGIWGLPYYDTKPAEDVSGGYQFARGTVSRIQLTRDWFSVTIDDALVILIKRIDWQERFSYSVVELDQASVALRGWVSAKKNRSTVVVSHPFMIERCEVDPQRLCPSH